MIKEFNPCEVSVNNGVCRCLAAYKNSDYAKPNELCCDDCQFHTNKGCVAEKPLTCKLWLCPIAEQKYPEVHKKLRQLWKIADCFGFWAFRGDKKMSLDNAVKIYSISK